MADLINRDHAAQAIEAYLCSQCDRNGNRECIACPYLDGDEILKSVQSVNNWISCNERLPEKYGEYQVYFGTCDHDLNSTDAIDKRYYGDKSDGTVGWHSLCSSDITHWMPLPKPPKGSDRNG